MQESDANTMTLPCSSSVVEAGIQVNTELHSPPSYSNLHSKHQICHASTQPNAPIKPHFAPIKLHSPSHSYPSVSTQVSTTNVVPPCPTSFADDHHNDRRGLSVSNISISEKINSHHSHTHSHSHSHHSQSHSSGHNHGNHGLNHGHHTHPRRSKHSSSEQVLGPIYSGSDSSHYHNEKTYANTHGHGHHHQKSSSVSKVETSNTTECRCSASRRSHSKNGSSSNRSERKHHRHTSHGHSSRSSSSSKYLQQENNNSNNSINPADNNEVTPALLPSVPPPPPPPQRSPVHTTPPQSAQAQGTSSANPPNPANPTTPGPLTGAQKRRAKAIMVDRFSRVFFPSTFGLINAIYWVMFWIYL